jgi:hypothetical protein
MPFKRVVECVGASYTSIKKYYRNRTAQQWYFDQKSKTIKSNHWKGYSMSIQSNGNGKQLRMLSTNSRWFQMFRYQNRQLVNEKGKIVVIRGPVKDADQENRYLDMTSDKRGSWLNRFNIIYVKDY